MIKTSKGTKTERIHALDSLRAIMMLLGLVIHTVITYTATEISEVWPLKDPHSTSLIMDYILFVIHNFRMPIFFVVAGFFGALLFFERGPQRMLVNRVFRILFPFAVFILVLSPTLIFAFTYTGTAFSGAENPIAVSLSKFSNPLAFIPPGTFHMWFLYYLFLITIVSYVFGFIFEALPRFTNWTTKLFNQVLIRPIFKLVLFTFLTVILLLIMNTTWVATSNSWIPDWRTFLFYFFFYGFGWVLFKSKAHLDTFKRFDWLFIGAAVLTITVAFLLSPSLSFEMKILLNSVSVWLFIFGITGLFLRYGSQHSHLMRYNSDSSYWIYLVHLTIMVLLPGIIKDWQVSVYLKALFVFLTTSFICLVTYHYLVRATFIGKFLNGRKYSRNIHAKLKPE